MSRMANITINVPGMREAAGEVRRMFKELAAQLSRVKAVQRERRAYLNMLRAPRRKRRTATCKWELAKLHVRAAQIRCECPGAEVRIVSRNIRKGTPVVLIETIFARGTIEPTTTDRCVLLLGHQRPVQVLAMSDGEK
jgi:hypothetical protein